MTYNTLLVSSPLFFVHPSRAEAIAIECSRGQRFSKLSRQAFELIYLFLDPAPLSLAFEQGYDARQIEEALDAGLLVRAGTKEHETLQLWEEHGWSYAAYLLFTQQNLDYLEPVDSGLSLPELSELRRRHIQLYIDEEAYPERRLADSALIIALPDAEPITTSLDALVARRSCRAFNLASITLDDFSRTLFTSTIRVRMAEDSKASGDPYYLLNSFYTWLDVYVAVQGVEGLERGIYQYDTLRHELRHVNKLGDDKEISSCIQRQDWIGGGGFSLFVVVEWHRYMWLYRHSRAYINLLVQLGEFGQEVLQAAYSIGLAGWLTPAVNESLAAAFLRLDTAREDAMSFIKIGPPPKKL
jgi:SagB-type dehydrogenase family enzyme